jgi:hypothetical protein
VSLSWPAGANATSYRIERRTTPGGTFAPIATAVNGTSYVDSAGLVANTGYEYQVRSENSTANSGFTVSNQVTTTTPTVALFETADINSVPTGSTAIVTEGSAYDMTAGGVDLYGTKDGFRFTYKSVTGDFDVKSQITSMTNASSGTAKAGLMARATLGSTSINAISEATVAGQYRLGYRSVTGDVTTLVKKGTPAYPNVWVRLTRVGNLFTAYYGTDGTNWTTTGSVTLANMPSTVFLGMALSANNTSNTVSASFRNVSIP